MSRSTWTHATFWAGLAILFFGAIIQLIVPPAHCADVSMPDATLALQFARNDAEIRAVFGPAEDACAIAMASNLLTSLYLDLLAFVPIFGFFAFVFFLAAGTPGSPLIRIGLACVVVSSLADVAETVLQIRAIEAQGADMRFDPVIRAATLTKYVVFAGEGAAVTLLLLRQRPLVVRALSVLSATGTILVLARLPGLVSTDGSYAMLLVWLAMLGWAAHELFWPGGAAVEGAERGGP